jgi:rod shape-determining protein MreD
MKHRLIWIIILLLTLTLQMIIVPHLLLQQLKIDLVLLVVISFSLLQGSRQGLIFGLLAGLICDSFVGHPFGVQMLLKGLIGGAVGRLNGMYLENQLGVPLLAATGAWTLNELLQHTTYKLFYRGEFWPSQEYWKSYLPTMVSEILVFIVFYYCIRWILLNEKRAGLIKD